MSGANHTPRTVALACLEHRPRPNSRYTAVPPHEFVGTSVLLGFRGTDDQDVERTEHMWIYVTSTLEHSCGDELLGVLDNVPFLKMEYACGDSISFKREEIQDCRRPECGANCETIHRIGDDRVKN